ncbi:unnamed protein product [marine sediment metagenome]|uniref:Uncharacterized protein n=1 Tax=marine sediment metagenome TaxID=412755 RepID=X1PZK7_9ZZZZ
MNKIIKITSVIFFISLILLIIIKSKDSQSCGGCSECTAAEMAGASVPYLWGHWDCPPIGGGEGSDCSGMASREFGLCSKQNVAWFVTNSSPCDYMDATI